MKIDLKYEKKIVKNLWKSSKKITKNYAFLIKFLSIFHPFFNVLRHLFFLFQVLDCFRCFWLIFFILYAFLSIFTQFFNRFSQILINCRPFLTSFVKFLCNFRFLCIFSCYCSILTKISTVLNNFLSMFCILYKLLSIFYVFSMIFDEFFHIMAEFLPNFQQFL